MSPCAVYDAKSNRFLPAVYIGTRRFVWDGAPRATADEAKAFAARRIAIDPNCFNPTRAR